MEQNPFYGFCTRRRQLFCTNDRIETSSQIDPYILLANVVLHKLEEIIYVSYLK